MTLGSVLLQPQRLARASAGTDAALVQDALHLVSLLIEDASRGGKLLETFALAGDAVGPRIQAQIESRMAVVQGKLRAWLRTPIDYVTNLGPEIERTAADSAADPTAAFELIERLLGDLTSVANALTLNEIRGQAGFFVEILENDLGISTAFLEAQIYAIFDDVIARWEALPIELDARRRQNQRAAIATMRRLRALLKRKLDLPSLDPEALARAIHGFLRDAGIDRIVAELNCALEGLKEAANASADLAEALPLTVNGQDAGAAIINIEGASEYAWYASWLLELGAGDLEPLLGLSDLEKPGDLIRRLKAGGDAVSAFLYDHFTEEQKQALDAYSGPEEPPEELQLIVLGVVNGLLQGTSIYDAERFPNATLSEETEEKRGEYRDDQELLLFNRMFLEDVYDEELCKLPRGFWDCLRHSILGAFGSAGPVYVSGDKRFVMLGDKPMLLGENVSWEGAPIFSTPERGQNFYHFVNVSKAVCEGFAQHTAWPAEGGKAAWHLAEIQPGHEIGTAILGSLEILHSLTQLFFGKPIDGFEKLGGFGTWLASSIYGPKALAILGGSFQGSHTGVGEGTDVGAKNFLAFWFTVVLGDVVRFVGPNAIIDNLRNLILSWITLWNFRGPRDGPSTLPSHPARNNQRQEGVTSLVNVLCTLWLVSYYERDDYSIEIFSGDDIGENRERAFALWLGGGIGMGLLSGLIGTLISQITAWGEDWKLFGKTLVFSVLSVLWQFWIIVYSRKEGDTDDGVYDTGGGDFTGYPDKSEAPSPYRLPYAAGTALYCGQGNLGLWSHNPISSSGANQSYALDFGHDKRQAVRAARAGTVVSFREGTADEDDSRANRIIIRHDVDDDGNPITPDDVHDNPFGRATGSVTYARYLHGVEDGVTDAFGGTAPTPGVTTVRRGQVIMLAGDTGTSFHNHLHMDVLLDDGSGNPGAFSIPFVFDDVDGDGRCLALTWYRAGDDG